MGNACFIAINGAVSMTRMSRSNCSVGNNGLIGFHGKAAYDSAKHGVIGLTKVGALEGAADGITVWEMHASLR
jgi:NAD(P)-dependent dehydrogenase (short-subunit alcohol dehydrogenase family)